MSHKHSRRGRKRTFRKAEDRQQRPPERTHEDLLWQLWAKLDRIQDKHGPQSEEAGSFIKKHSNVRGFEEMALIYTAAKNSIPEDVMIGRVNDENFDFTSPPT